MAMKDRLKGRKHDDGSIPAHVPAPPPAGKGPAATGLAGATPPPPPPPPAPPPPPPGRSTPPPPPPGARGPGRQGASPRPAPPVPVAPAVVEAAPEPVAPLAPETVAEPVWPRISNPAPSDALSSLDEFQMPLSLAGRPPKAEAPASPTVPVTPSPSVDDGWPRRTAPAAPAAAAAPAMPVAPAETAAATPVKPAVVDSPASFGISKKPASRSGAPRVVKAPPTAIVAMLKVRGDTKQLVAAYLEHERDHSAPPAGVIMRYCHEDLGGITVVDIWESEAHMRRWLDATPGQPTPTTYRVFDMWAGIGD
ncbi:MAG: hypothetical protein AB7L13_19515 [Acidimicrobiia bacterium]